MIHGHEDLFIGAAAILCGSLLVTAAVANWPWYYSLRSARFLESKLSRTGARIAHCLLGLTLIALGLAVAAGLRCPLWR